MTVLATLGAPTLQAAQKAVPAAGAASCYSSLLSGPPPTLSAFVQSINSNGTVVVNGNDSAQPTAPFQFAWGDGSTTSGFFPQQHVYTNASQNYVITITATENGGATQQFSFPVFFTAPPITPQALPGISFQIPSQSVTLQTHYPYPPPSDVTFFSDSSFPIYSRSDVAYLLASASSIDYNFANNNSFLLNGVFSIDMLENTTSGGGISFWWTTPMAVGFGSTPLNTPIQWFILFNEIGKDTTLNTPVSFPYGGNTDGDASEIYSETMGDIFSYAAGCQLIGNAASYGIGPDVALDIQNSMLAGAANLQGAYNTYVADGAPFSSWNPNNGGPDPTLGTVAALAWKFIEHAETQGQGYQVPVSRLMTLLQQFDSSMLASYDPTQDTSAAATFRSTLMVAALSYAFSEDLRSEFESLNFPIDNETFNQLYEKVTGGGASLSPATAAFAPQNVGSTSAGQTFTLTNNLLTPISITSASFSGANPADFPVQASSTCPYPTGTLAANSSCTYVMAFAPSVGGAESSTFSVADTDGTQALASSPQTINLTGTGVAPSGSFQQMPGSLSKLSVGVDGTVCGINSASRIYCFNPQTQNWTGLPGLLTQIAVGAKGIMWGLTAAGDIYRYDPGTGNWDYIPGNLSRIAVGSDGDVWGLSSSNGIYHFDSTTQNWIRIPGALTVISVGFDGAVWGINAGQQIFRFNPGTQSWQRVPGLLAQIAVGADGDVWGVNSASQIYHFNPLTQNWDHTPGSLAQIAVGSGNDVWGIDGAGAVWHFDSQIQSWDQIPETLAQIAVGANGAVWGINGAQQIYQFVQVTQPTGTFHRVPGLLSQIAVGLDGEVWGINNASQIYHFNPLTQNWDHTLGSLAQIAVGFGGNVWGIDSGGRIWRFNHQTQSWNQIPGLLAQIAVGANGDVWGINSASQVYRFNLSTQNWDRLPGLLTQLSAGADGSVWGINSLEKPYRFNPQTQNWDQIPGSLSQVAVGSANNVWGLSSNGEIWRFDSLSQALESIPGSLAHVAVGFDGEVWGINSANQISRFNAQTQNWDLIPGSLTTLAVGADALTWGLNASNQIYFFR
jgi:Tectonin domain